MKQDDLLYSRIEKARQEVGDWLYCTYTVLGGGILFLFLINCYQFYCLKKIKHKTQKIVHYNQEIATHQQKINALQQESDSLNSTMEFIDAWRASQSIYYLLDIISESLPGDVRLNKISINGALISLEGTGLLAESITHFINALKKHTLCKELSLKELHQESEQSFFVLDIHYSNKF